MSQPTTLYHCLQGWPPEGPNAFRWERGALVYMLSDLRRDPSTWDRVMVPTTSQWQDFWTACDEVDVWSWPPSLGDTSVIDGLQWIIDLEVGGRRVKSTGQVDGAPPGIYESLMRLHRLLQGMVGWHESEKKWAHRWRDWLAKQR